ncbi:hypothetical protein DSL64_24015 [Dyadobacter luteus]|jgi:hypothetical protein|uniref:DUF3575 domain-containing protein n=1 Tax=Dyadobacter luteus TaxID=2259619 RepID=A0A3D8Y578_9BACT|nr:hypothetical protein [Dyadobacter luteus]REA57423.1 hypothetical protein DSL64_24015 [Dyadobacter luteus]
MKSIYICLFILFLPGWTYAQWEKQIGVNVIPAIGKSLEVNSEIRENTAYSLNLALGYTFNSRHAGVLDRRLYDGISDLETSGAFVKAGGKIYPFGFKGKSQKASLYVGGFAVLSQYKQNAIRDISYSSYRDPANPDFDHIPVSARGIIVFPAATIGFSSKISRQLMLDWGIQKSFVTGRKDFIGKEFNNYQPGAGTPQRDSYIGYIQGVVSVKYRFDPLR